MESRVSKTNRKCMVLIGWNDLMDMMPPRQMTLREHLTYLTAIHLTIQRTGWLQDRVRRGTMLLFGFDFSGKPDQMNMLVNYLLTPDNGTGFDISGLYVQLETSKMFIHSPPAGRTL